MQITAYIGFGGNLGDVTSCFQAALGLLSLKKEISHIHASPLYKTEPLTPSYKKDENQNWYLNAVIALKTTLGLHELFAYLQEIELSLGRTRSKKWASRLIDLDLLFYGDIIYHDNELSIPHREMIKRRFVLEPFCDLAPDFIHPEMQMTMQELLGSLDDPLHVQRFQNVHTEEINAS